jgi:hypothetical protein
MSLSETLSLGLVVPGATTPSEGDGWAVRASTPEVLCVVSLGRASTRLVLLLGKAAVLP